MWVISLTLRHETVSVSPLPGGKIFAVEYTCDEIEEMPDEKFFIV